MKTNKSFSKRLRVTKTGKLIARHPGGNHFNAKESRSKQMRRKRAGTFIISRKLRGRFLPRAAATS